MIKAEIKKEIMITNKEIAQFLWEDGSLFEEIEGTLGDMLYDRYKMDYTSRSDAVEQLTNADYNEILIFLANKLIE